MTQSLALNLASAFTWRVLRTDEPDRTDFLGTSTDVSLVLFIVRMSCLIDKKHNLTLGIGGISLGLSSGRCNTFSTKEGGRMFL